MSDIFLQTERLLIRPWLKKDIDPFAELCADPHVMRFFPKTLSYDEAASVVWTAMEKTTRDGFCFAPIEKRDSSEFLGFVGLSIPRFSDALSFAPCIEIGWRLKKAAWGKGYATEAAGEWLRFGFDTLELKEIVSFTARQNLPSIRVMERLGMRYSKTDDFQIPTLPEKHPLSWHVLYKVTHDEFRSSKA
ncbi:RimJ/RimL family protein N-acetyltransferase [Roseibium hamelinense]|uniref:RimJ/RimL family protein N-acetyltransferase n=1 Tax=Roseibium hamelinense TaxID=150831 RepID=A0A562SNQ1_9HYPH|nr:GNAT family N-acetyltransferase [Roseibium hamelinense]MTI43976.1 N-acetyltransferase [Roseibium hamelinense]TWI82818.1 RimJ/RimL family protein N-acetyltransferase [Roseibium hamelinense]